MLYMDVTGLIWSYCQAALLEQEKYTRAILHLALADLISRLAALANAIHPSMQSGSKIQVSLIGLSDEQVGQCKSSLGSGWTDTSVQENQVGLHIPFFETLLIAH